MKKKNPNDECKSAASIKNKSSVRAKTIYPLEGKTPQIVLDTQGLRELGQICLVLANDDTLGDAVLVGHKGKKDRLSVIKFKKRIWKQKETT